MRGCFPTAVAGEEELCKGSSDTSACLFKNRNPGILEILKKLLMSLKILPYKICQFLASNVCSLRKREGF